MTTPLTSGRWVASGASVSPPRRKEGGCGRCCYGAEFLGRADPEAAVAAMKVRGRWSRAVPPLLSYPASAPEVPSLRLSGYPPGTSESSAEGGPPPASGALTSRADVVGSRTFPTPTAPPSASPRPGESPGPTCTHAWWAPLRAGPCPRPRGPEADPLVLASPSVPLPTACPLPPRVLELAQMLGAPRDCRRTETAGRREKGLCGGS